MPAPLSRGLLYLVLFCSASITTSATNEVDTLIGPTTQPEVATADRGTSQAISNFIENFFHNQDLGRATKSCLEDASSELVDVVFQLGEKLSKLIMDMSSGAKDMDSEEGAIMLELTASAGGIVDAVQKLTQECNNAELRRALGRVGAHLTNGSFLLRHLEANIDCVYVEAVASAKAVNQSQYGSFGGHLGSGLRCLLLSEAVLPEGPPGPNVTGAVLDGVMAGFFGNDTSIVITQAGDPDPGHVIHMDVAQCLHNNMPFWDELWSDIWVMCSSMANQPDAEGRTTVGHRRSMEQVQTKWEDASTRLLLDMPAALERCGVSGEQLTMLVDSLAAVNRLHFNFTMPPPQDLYETLETLGKAVDAWEDSKYYEFGRFVGLFLSGILGQFTKGTDGIISAADRGLTSPRSQAASPVLKLGPWTVVAGMAALSAALVLRRSVNRHGWVAAPACEPQDQLDVEEEIE